MKQNATDFIGIVVYNDYYTPTCILRLHHVSDLSRMLTMRAVNRISLLMTSEKQEMW